MALPTIPIPEDLKSIVSKFGCEHSGIIGITFTDKMQIDTLEDNDRVESSTVVKGIQRKHSPVNQIEVSFLEYENYFNNLGSE